MKLWVSGGQTDEFMECIPRDNKCSHCPLRFQCLTEKEFSHRPGNSNISAEYFWVFYEMSKK
jgi:hypothetical protein